MKKKICILIFIFIFIIQLSFYSFCDDIDDETIDVNAEIEYSTNNTDIKVPDVNSRACVVIDRNSNIVLYGKNENSIRKMASTTKIMTATIIIENCNLNETVEISKKSAGTGGSRLGLKTGDKITILDLLYGLMMRSGNDAAVALAEYAGGSIDGFAELMNNKALELGLNHTHFETPHGLDSDEHYTTAYELALLSNYALKNETFAKIVGSKNYTITINGSPKELSNTNELLGSFEGVYGIKTGFTNGANRCLVTACKRNDMDIICVVLGADTKKFRTSDSIKLINYVINNFQNVNIQELIDENFEKWKKENSDSFIINKGITQNVKLDYDKMENPIIPIRKDLVNSIEISFDYKSSFESPLYINTNVGKIHVFISEDYTFDYNIFNTSEIRRKSWFKYLFDLCKSYSYILSCNII